MGKTTVEELENYCRDVIGFSEKRGKDWAFGAIDFARMAGLIDSKEYKELTGKFRLLGDGGTR